MFFLLNKNTHTHTQGTRTWSDEDAQGHLELRRFGGCVPWWVKAVIANTKTPKGMLFGGFYVTKNPPRGIPLGVLVCDFITFQ